MAEARSLFDDLESDPESDRQQRERERPAAPAPEPPPPQVLTVGQLSSEIRARMEGMGRVSVEGEVSRVKRATSGHVYFDLKDAEAVLACVIWRSNVARAARFELEPGDKVVAHGRLDVYPPRGTYSLNVQRLERSGLGALLAKFEEQKRELKERGWFDRARPLPPMPRMVGVVTSRDGAALRDFLRTRSLRWPLYPVRLAHAPVQGPGSAAEIGAAIGRLDRSGVDVIVVCRGGGSLEDLWAFNELPVANAIRAASVPVVSGVGHEVDNTLADLVADHRAHTPTDAAQRVIPDRAALEQDLERLSAWLAQAMGACLEHRAERLARLARSRVLRDPRWITLDRARTLRELGRRLQVGVRSTSESRLGRARDAHRRLQSRSPRWLLDERAARLSRAAGRLSGLAERRVVAGARRVEVAAARLDAYSPLKILGRGYSITTREGDPGPLREASAVSPGERIRTRLHRGEVESEVRRVRADEEEA